MAALVRHLPTPGHGTGAEPQVLADRPDGTVVRFGPVVCKVHAADSDPAELAARLRVAAHPRLRDCLLAPLPIASPPLPSSRPAPGPAPSHPSAAGPAPARPLLAPVSDGRMASLWPYGVPISPDDRKAAPWEALGILLARLHRVPVDALPGPVPPMRGPAKVAAALDRLRAAPVPVATSPAARAVHGAAAALPAWARGAAPAPRTDHLCHGDLHLGQLVGSPPTSPFPEGAAADGWLLIDVDDLGHGDPAWDLARPAAWFATGLLDPDEWTRLLTAYRTAGGTAAGEGDDPWPRLDVPARALTVQSAALGLAKAAAAGRALEAAEQAMVDACARMTGGPTAPDAGLPTSPPA
ncbi:phosphotransferase [Streptomyces sp. 71268]|uniref:phosphotransferase n=1 Tax=Streptomyces sp. 71268 TaxID=3002640 RepID=UPI0023F992E2|nr:phosphotransferase [Streptomyces sp. 71268]WEV29601.1 phosphotransferase [Streptomyces sp. 71268]